MSFTVTDDEKKYLLTLARSTIASEWDKDAANRIELPAAVSGALDARCGAFVTLHEGGKLRGCIGNMIGRQALRDTVRAMASAAAFEDPRFSPLKKDDLPRCRIEISVLSPMSRCPDPQTVVVGTHGLYLIRSGRSGVLLPQVPVEQGWNRQEYLDYICIKAGLPAASYAADDAELYTFTAVVFSES
ncbi:MAG: AmmeMemoRadiSam system protein A [Treponemataceae bacterium]